MELKTLLRHEVVGPANSPHRLRIAHLSDFHLWFNDRKLRRLEPLLADWQPDVVALTGDYADTPVGRRLAASWIERMAEAHPLCWVAGNHDRWWGRSFLHQLETLRRAHAIDRRDAWVTGKNGHPFRVTSWPRLAEPGILPAPTVVLLHDPTCLEAEKLPAGTDCLLLAGHLHGGQINLWHDRQGRPQPASMCYRWLVERGMVGRAPLIVSRGLGDTWPVRVRAPHEIVMIDYHARAAVGPSAHVACAAEVPSGRAPG